MSLFALVFGRIAALLIIFGSFEMDYRFYLGIGVTLYGLAYFLVHDVLIHQRFKWFQNTKSWYLIGLRKAHKVHHKHLGKEEGECFGMLNVPFKYYQIAKKNR